MPKNAKPKHDKTEDILTIEEDMRRCKTIQELAFFIANEIRHIIKAEYIFVLKRQFNQNMHIISASDIAIIDRHTPAITQIEQILKAHLKKNNLNQQSDINLKNNHDSTQPFANLSWFPFTIQNSQPYAGILVVKSQNWSENDALIANRIIKSSAYCWAALITRKKILKKKYTQKKLIPIIAIPITIIALFIPVPLTTIAPMETIPENPAIIAAHINGVIKNIHVKPNQTVTENQILYTINDVKIAGDVNITQKEVILEQATLDNIKRAAFSSQKDKHNINIQKAKLDLKKIQLQFQKNQLDKTIMRAPKNGIVIFSDEREWIGKPIVAGQKIMEIAKPNEILFRIYVPTQDVSVIKNNAHIRLFLDSDALNPISAHIIRADHNAKINEQGQLAFTVIAKADNANHTIPRLGTRGTAQIFGEKIPLFLFLLRRPIIAIRQWSGI